MQNEYPRKRGARRQIYQRWGLLLLARLLIPGHRKRRLLSMQITPLIFGPRFEPGEKSCQLFDRFLFTNANLISLVKCAFEDNTGYVRLLRREVHDRSPSVGARFVREDSSGDIHDSKP